MKTLLDLINIIKSKFNNSKPQPIIYKPQINPVTFTITPPIEIKQYRVSNYEKCNYVRYIKYIILHSTGGTISSTLSWFKNSESKVSTHYTIDKNGILYEMVDDNNIAWHAGKSEWNGETGLNKNSIGIELENLNDGNDKYTTAQIGAALWLCAKLMKKYSIPIENLLRHKDIAPNRKIDPVNFPFEEFKDSLKCAL